MSISAKIMNEIFRFSKNFVYSLRSGVQFEKPSINTVPFGSKSTVYLGAKIGELIPENIKSSESVDIFKSKVKNRYQKFVHAYYAKYTSIRLVL